MNSETRKFLSAEQTRELLQILKTRFEQNMQRHKGLVWTEIQTRLDANPGKLWSLHEMEKTGGEPDVIGNANTRGEYLFCDCSAETPAGRRSVCYDIAALESRKEHKPVHSAVGLANEMGIELLSEEQYHEFQQFGNFDTKTSSWLSTPESIRQAGGAIFGDRRYGRVFIYHNGAESYYAVRGFRGFVRV